MNRQARNKAYAEKTVDARKLKNALKSIRDGRVPRSATLLAFGWGQKEIELIRGGGGTDVLISTPPNAFEEGVWGEPPPRISWAEIIAFWLADRPLVDASGAHRMETRDGKQVAQRYTERTKKANALVFRQLAKIYNQNPDDDAVPVLSRPKDVMLRLAQANQKSAAQRKLDATTLREPDPAATAKLDMGDDEDEDGPLLSSMPKILPKERNAILANVGPVYANKLGSIAATFRIWSRFRDSIGQAALVQYRTSSEGFLPALEHNAQVSTRKTTSDAHAIPSYELLLKFLPKIKEKLGNSTAYLAALLQVKLLGLRDDLGAVEILTGDGPEYDPKSGVRQNWYSRSTGRLYIPLFKTMRARGSKPYDFTLTPSLRHAVDDSLLNSKRKWLVGIGLSAAGKPNPVGPKIRDAFAKAGLQYRMMHNGKSVLTSAKPVDIRHAQVVYYHRRLIKKNPGISPAVVADEIAQFFRHSRGVNVNYLRRTFDGEGDGN